MDKQLRRTFLQRLSIGLSAALAPLPSIKVQAADSPPEPYNLLMIVLDDLNDWAGYLGAHPQAKTPNIDKLSQSSIAFHNAVCQVPLCNASRTATLTGLLPQKTNIWWNYQSEAVDFATLPDQLRLNGYKTTVGGKIHHHFRTASWDKNVTAGGHYRGTPVDEETCVINCTFDVSPVEESKEELRTYKTAMKIASELTIATEPFAIFHGIDMPHTPYYLPQEYFDRFPIEDIVLPQVIDNDLDDIPPNISDYPNPIKAKLQRQIHAKIVDIGMWEELVQGYLAATAYADDCVGVTLDALEASGKLEQTIVVLWSDHGLHLGQKQRWGKSTLWGESLRVPLLMRVPGYTPGACTRAVGLIDIYPTIMDLLRITPPYSLDGRSLIPLLENPNAEWNYPVPIMQDRHFYGARTEHWRFARRLKNGVVEEELYHVSSDPNEFKNLASNPFFNNVKSQLDIPW